MCVCVYRRLWGSVSQCRLLFSPTLPSTPLPPQVWNPCMYNRSEGVGVLSNTGATNVIEGEYMAAGRRVLHYVTGDLIGGTGVSSNVLRIDKNHQYISVATMLVPSLDRMMGVAGLDMCDGRRWKKHVRVCGELFSTGYRTNITKRPNTLQDRNCSFGYFDFRLMPPPEPILNRDECPRDRSPSPPTPTRPSPPPPTGGRPSPRPSPPPVGWHSPPANSCLCQPKCKCKHLTKLVLRARSRLCAACLKAWVLLVEVCTFLLLLVNIECQYVAVYLNSVLFTSLKRLLL